MMKKWNHGDDNEETNWRLNFVQSLIIYDDLFITDVKKETKRI
jgi:hypothetical protein